MHALVKLAGILVALALLVGATAFATHALGDRALLVPPPDAVAEGFVREVTEQRYPRAQPYLQHPVPEADLRALDQSLYARVGHPDTIEAKTITRTPDEALVIVRLASKKGSEAISFALVFEEEWKIVME